MPKDSITSEMDIAVIGMACRFPGAEDINAYWENLKQGKESITILDDKELIQANIDPREFNLPNYMKVASIIDNYKKFDAKFFDYSPREAALLDPQHRLFLETVWSALDNAGYHTDDAECTLGVFGGSNISYYLINNLFRNRSLSISGDHFFIQIANDKDNLATRTAYKLNARGPSVSIQSACSTSLVSIHFACQSLLYYECDLALAGGVAVRVPQKIGYLYQSELICSKDGHCRPFDAQASGTIFGNGVGAVVLKRLSDAIEDHDHIVAVIKSSAVNNDGSDKIGFTAPSQSGQENVIQAAMQLADISPATIGLIECHGTGTLLGDPIEIAALNNVWRQYDQPVAKCPIGSVKGNIGHLECAAGIASFIKMALCLSNAWRVPSINFNKANPNINFDDSPFHVQTESGPWTQKNGYPRRGSVSSFGIGGTNAHVIMEQFPKIEKPKPSGQPQLIVLSSKTAKSLNCLTQKLVEDLRSEAGQNRLDDIAHTLKVGRKPFNYRRFAIGSTTSDIIQSLETLDPKTAGSNLVSHAEPGLVFMFPGQGAQYAGMGLNLYRKVKYFREIVDYCCTHLEKYMGLDIREIIFTDQPTEALTSRLNQTLITQPALFTIEYALSELLMSWKIKPDVMIGHSIGEYVAACLAGVFSLEDALKIVAKRAQIIDSMPPGKMCTLNLPKKEAKKLIPDHIWLSLVNSPNLTVVSGAKEDISELCQTLEAKDICYRVLHTSHAFHSGMMKPVCKPFIEAFKDITLNEPKIPYYSNVTGERITSENATYPQYWANHLIRPVIFGPAVEKMYNEENNLFLEVGPGRTLNMLVKDINREIKAVQSMPHAGENGDALFRLAHFVGQLWLNGVPVDAVELQDISKLYRVPISGYQFDSKTYWIEPATTKHADKAETGAMEDIVITDDDEEEQTGIEQGIDYIAPRNKTEAQIAEFFKQTLGIRKISVNDNFLDLGGHSLLATQLLDKINAQYQIKILLSRFFENDTVAGVAQILTETELEDVVPTEFEDFPKADPDPENRYEPFPLHEMQQAQWIGRMGNFAMSGVAAHIYIEVENQGLDLERLRHSWQQMVDRHDMLRAVILPEGVQQVLKPPVKYDIKNLDLRSEPLEVIETKLRKIRARLDHVVRPVDQWPLFEVRTTQLPGDKIRIHFSIDLLICDFSSMRMLLYEWATAYSGAIDTLPKLEFTFRDYVLAEEKIKGLELFRTSEQYWDKRIKTLPAAPQLPMKKNPNEILKPRFKRISCLFETKTWNNIKAHAQKRRISPSIIIIAAFSRIIGKWSKEKQFSLNTTIINRMPVHPQVYSLLGEFASFAPLAVHLTRVATLEELADQLQHQNWRNLENRYVSGVAILRKLAQQSGVTTGAVLPVVVTSTLVQNVEDRFMKYIGGEHKYGISQTPQVWLDHTIMESDKGLTLSWHYVEDLFEEELINAMWGAYCKLIHALGQNDKAWESRSYNALPKDQVEMIQKVNHTKCAFPKAALHEPFFINAALYPDQPAIITARKTITYKEAANLSTKLAGLLRSKQIKSGEVVAFVMEKGWMQIIAALGILKAGAAYLPIDHNVPDDRLNYLITNSNARYVIAEKDYHRDFSALQDVEIITVDEASLLAADDVQIETTVATDSLAYIIYTSGSTGRPKGVMITHDAAMNTILDMNRRYEVGKNDRAIAISEMSFDLSVYDVFGMFTAGGGLVIPSAEAQRDPERWVELVINQDVTIWNSVPAFVEMLVQHLEDNPAQLPLKNIWMSGDWIPVTLPGRIKEIFKHTKIISLGGATEASIWSITYLIENVDSEWESVPYGKPLSNQRFYVLDEFLEQCPYWTPGELYIGGDGLALGYINDQEKTRQAFIAHPRTGEKLYRTGDWGFYRPDGNIIFLGREDLQVKISGYRIELGEIEVVLNQHPLVKSVIVNTWETQSGRKQLIGYIIPAEQAKPEISDIKKFLSEKLPNYMIPNDFVLMETFPLSPNGKIDRKALSGPILSLEGGDEEGHFDEKTQYVIDKLKSIFTNLLGLEKVDIHQNFFSMGGDSILGIQIINDANKAGIHITPQDLFEKQTIAALAATIDTNQFSLSNKMHDQYPDDFNLAPYQKWYAARFPHNQSNYAAIFRTRAFIKAEILEAAYQHLINHFDVLQIQIRRDGNRWYQYYSDSNTLAELNFVDLTSDEVDHFEETMEQIREQLEEMQDLSESPILKLCVLQNSETQNNYLLLVAHQLIMDMRSLEIFIKELNTVYGRLINGEEVNLTRSGHFHDWVHISEKKAETETIKRKIEKYAAELTQVPEVLRLKPHNNEIHYDRHASSIDIDVQNELPKVLSMLHLSAQEFFLLCFTEAFGSCQNTKSVYLDWVVHPSKDYLNQTNFSATMGPLGWAYPITLNVNVKDQIEEHIRQAKARLRKHTQNGEDIDLIYCLPEKSMVDVKGRLPDIKFQYQEYRDITGFGEMISGQFCNQSGLYSLEVDVQLIGEQLDANWHYDPECFTPVQIKELSAKLTLQVENLIANTQKYNQKILHFSDFPQANLTQEELDAFVTGLTTS